MWMSNSISENAVHNGKRSECYDTVRVTVFSLEGYPKGNGIHFFCKFAVIDSTNYFNFFLDFF